eukprot:sb/3465426/
MAEFKKSGKRRNVRKREKSSSDGSDGDEESAVVRGERRTKAVNPLKSASCSIKKLKEEREVLLSAVSSKKTAAPEVDGGATKILETETTKDEDATTIFRRNLELSKEAGEGEKELYKGSGAYQRLIEVKDSAIANAGGGQLKAGPIRRPDHLRATVRWDYAPDVCKDYKETGFCGFGDSCKFMHDRSDYKSGWQLEREWAQNDEIGTDLRKRGPSWVYRAASKSFFLNRSLEVLLQCRYIAHKDMSIIKRRISNVRRGRERDRKVIRQSSLTVTLGEGQKRAVRERKDPPQPTTKRMRIEPPRPRSTFDEMLDSYRGEFVKKEVEERKCYYAQLAGSYGKPDVTAKQVADKLWAVELKIQGYTFEASELGRDVAIEEASRRALLLAGYLLIEKKAR